MSLNVSAEGIKRTQEPEPGWCDIDPFRPPEASDSSVGKLTRAPCKIGPE